MRAKTTIIALALTAAATAPVAGPAVGATGKSGSDGGSIEVHSSADFTRTSISIRIRNRVVYGTVSNSDERCFRDNERVNLLRDHGVNERGDDLRYITSTKLADDGRYRFPKLRLRKYAKYYTQISSELTCTTGTSRTIRYRGN